VLAASGSCCTERVCNGLSAATVAFSLKLNLSPRVLLHYALLYYARFLCLCLRCCWNGWRTAAAPCIPRQQPSFSGLSAARGVNRHHCLSSASSICASGATGVERHFCCGRQPVRRVGFALPQWADVTDAFFVLRGGAAHDSATRIGCSPPSNGRSCPSFWRRCCGGRVRRFCCLRTTWRAWRIRCAYLFLHWLPCAVLLPARAATGACLRRSLAWVYACQASLNGFFLSVPAARCLGGCWFPCLCSRCAFHQHQRWWDDSACVTAEEPPAGFPHHLL